MTLSVPVAMRAHVHSEHKLGVSAPVGPSVSRLRADDDGFIVSTFTYDDRPPKPVDFAAGGFPVAAVETALFGADFGSLEERLIANISMPSGIIGMYRPNADVIGFAVNGSPTGREVQVQKARQMGVTEWKARHLTIDKVDAQEMLDRMRSEHEDVYGYMQAIHDELCYKHLTIGPAMLELPKEQRVAPNFVEQGDNANAAALRFVGDAKLGVSGGEPLRLSGKMVEINVERKPAPTITVDVQNLPKDCVGYEVRDGKTGERKLYVTVGDVRSDAKPANFKPMQNWRDTIHEMHPELDSVVGRSYRPLGRFAGRSLYAVFDVRRRVTELWSVSLKGSVARTTPKHMMQYDAESPFGEALRRAYDDGMFQGLPVYPPSDNRAYRL